jgi:hypothetical protein
MPNDNPAGFELVAKHDKGHSLIHDVPLGKSYRVRMDVWGEDHRERSEAIVAAVNSAAYPPPQTHLVVAEAENLSRINAALEAIRTTCGTMECDDRHLIGRETLAALRDAAKLINELVWKTCDLPSPQSKADAAIFEEAARLVSDIDNFHPDDHCAISLMEQAGEVLTRRCSMWPPSPETHVVGEE